MTASRAESVSAMGPPTAALLLCIARLDRIMLGRSESNSLVGCFCNDIKRASYSIVARYRLRSFQNLDSIEVK